MRLWPVAAAGAIGAAGWGAYNAIAPTAQGYGRTFVGTPGDGDLLALTYDDGPNTAWTPTLLDLLDRHDVKATFFAIGRYARDEGHILREVAARGHAVGNHTFTHVTMPLHTDAAIRRELRETTAAIEAAGVEMAVVNGRRLMRPPYGRRRPGTVRVLWEEGYIPILWSVTLWDWSRGVTADKIMRKAERKVRGGDVILLHDGCDVRMGYDRSESIEATDRIIARWKSEGMRFVTIPELIAASGFTVDPLPA